MDDAEKRARAHVVIDTGGTLDATRRQVDDLLRALAGAAAG
jgi:dephospho-CoA kinase